MSLALVPVVEKHQSTVFFKILHQNLDGVQELRTFGPEGDSSAAKKLRSQANRLRDFVPVKNGVCDPKRIQRFLAGCEKAKRGAFCRVALRSQAALKDRKGDATHCQSLPAFFLDVDFKHLGEAETRKRIAAVPLPPSMMVESGGGLHPYWILAQPFYLKSEMAEAKRWLRHIAASVADVVDESVSEPARVLRIPGSHKFKPEYGEPRLVTLSVYEPERVYSLDQLRDTWGEPAQRDAETPHANDGPFQIPEHVDLGDRHTVLYLYLRSQKAKGVGLEEALTHCRALNEQKCHPPIATADLDSYLRRVWNQKNAPGFQDRGMFKRDKKTRAILAKNQHNVRLALEKLEVSIRFDTFNKKMCITYPDRHFSNHRYEDMQRNKVWLDVDKAFHFQIPNDFFDVIVAVLADDRSFNPVLEYLEGLTWDGVKRIDEWLMAYASAEDLGEYTRAVSRLLLMAAAARIYVPGCKFDEMVVLESGQGTGKSSLLRTLCPNPAWFTDDLQLNLDAKRVIENTGGKWIIEASELSGMHASKVEHLKSMISRQVDGPVRMAYARLSVTDPRRFVLVGTTNSHVYLEDPTGNRRFWPIRVGDVLLEELARDRDQLWAEAVSVLKNYMKPVGNKWELDGEAIRLHKSLYGAAEEEQLERQTEDPWESILAEAFSTEDVRVATQDVFTVLGLTVDKQNMQSCALGFSWTLDCERVLAGGVSR